LDIGVLGYIGIVWPKEHSPEVVTLTRGTPVYSSFYSYYARPSVVTVEETIYTTPEDGYNVNRKKSGFLLRF